MHVICFLILCLIVGCSSYEPVPVESSGAEATLTEQEVRDIAEEVANEVIGGVQKDAQSRAKDEQERDKKRADEESRLQHEAAAAAEEQAIADAVERSEEAYWLLVKSERMRVDAIRERIANDGLTRLDHEDIRWAWHGDGHDCLAAELLIAARKAQDQLEADTASLGLSDTELIDFFCLEPLEQLRRLHLAKQFVSGDPVEDDVIIEFRRDPFLAKLVAHYMKSQQKGSR
jgi:hypothetical protein